MVTPMMFMYPKLMAKIGTVSGGPKMNMKIEDTTGAPKCMTPYGSHPSTSRTGLVCFARMLEMLAP